MNSLSHDKALHGFYGTSFYSLIRIFIPSVVAALIVIAAAYAKEWYDGKNPEKHTKDWKDAVATYIVPVVSAIIETGVALWEYGIY